jgi:FMN-dependent dehydrogenase
MMPTLASCSIDEMTRARIDGQTQWFQLYVNDDRELTRKLILNAEKLGAKVLCVTVDAPALGRREKDMRVKFVDDAPSEHGDVGNRFLEFTLDLKAPLEPSLPSLVQASAGRIFLGSCLFQRCRSYSRTSNLVKMQLVLQELVLLGSLSPITVGDNLTLSVQESRCSKKVWLD